MHRELVRKLKNVDAIYIVPTATNINSDVVTEIPRGGLPENRNTRCLRDARKNKFKRGINRLSGVSRKYPADFRERVAAESLQLHANLKFVVHYRCRVSCRTCSTD